MFIVFSLITNEADGLKFKLTLKITHDVGIYLIINHKIKSIHINY